MRKYFGTDGIRRIANTELSPSLVFRVAKAGASVLSKHSEGKAPTILIGRDTRISGSLIESAMVAGFLSYGANVKTLGIIPTPAVAYLTKKYNANASVVISASHNTFEFNGVKYFSNKGMKIPDSLEEEIEDIMDSDEKLSSLTAVAEKIGVAENREDMINDYIDFIVGIFHGAITQNIDDNFRVLIDTANGATYKVADKIYTRLGINHDIINNKPDGVNINANCGSTHLEMLKEKVVEGKYSLGIAYDGDGDRCLAVDENGEEIDGDIMMAIASKYLKSKGKLNKDTVVATVMSNLGFNKYCDAEKLNFVQTKVGDRYVLEEMLKEGYNLGGEQSGHIIYLDYNPTGDGILTSLMLVQILLETKQTPSEARKTIKIYPQVLINAKVNSEKKNDYESDLEIKEAIKKLTEEFSGNGRVLIRPSGTEPLVRVMIEGEDQEVITKKARELADLIERKLK